MQIGLILYQIKRDFTLKVILLATLFLVTSEQIMSKTIVIKFGTSTLTHGTKSLSRPYMLELVKLNYTNSIV